MLEVLAHLLLSQTLHTQLHHLSAFQRLIQMIGPNSLCPLHLHCIIFWESVMNLTMMCRRAIFHLHFHEYFWNSLRALYFAGTVEWGQSGNAANKGENWGNLGRGEPQHNIRHFHWLEYVIILGAKIRLISILRNRRNKHLDLVMPFLFCGSHNYVYEAQRIWAEGEMV